MLHRNRQNNTLAEQTASTQLKSQCHRSSDTTDTTTANMSSECCDVIVAHSPPLFTAHNSPAELSVLYQNWLVISQKQQSPLPVRRLNAARSSNSPTRETQDKQQQEKQQLDKQQKTAALQVKTRRPCLVIRTDSDCSIGSLSSGSSSDENEPSSPTRRKKKVVFADDRGLSLTQVRLMNEPSNQPPKLMGAGSYLQNPAAASMSALSGGSAGLGMAAAKPAGVDQAQWRLRFPQPASNYLDFRKRLDLDSVSLENVIVKSADRWIVGTVKVRNLSYDKDVFVRCTRDKWTTHEDTDCAYVQNNAMVNGGGSGQNGSSNGGGMANIYDTFSFRLPLPADATFMEFAVCYKSPDFEHWDNNDGRNYGLSVEQPAAGPLNKPLSPSSSSAQLSPPQAPPPLLSAVCASPYDGNNKQQQLPPVHYFGALSNKQSSWWNTPRDQKKDSTSAYW